MSKDLTPDGMKRVLSTHEVPLDKILESPYMFEYASLISSNQYWHFFEQDLELENTQPSYERLKKHGENISQSEDRARNFEEKTTETNEFFRVHRRKAETKARQSALSGNSENRCQWKAKGKCAKGDAWSFRND